MSNFNFQTQILTGAQKRVARANLDVRAFTKAQAKRQIATSNSAEQVETFLKHANKQVQAAAEQKLQRLAHSALAA